MEIHAKDTHMASFGWKGVAAVPFYMGQAPSFLTASLICYLCGLVSHCDPVLILLCSPLRIFPPRAPTPPLTRPHTCLHQGHSRPTQTTSGRWRKAPSRRCRPAQWRRSSSQSGSWPVRWCWCCWPGMAAPVWLQLVQKEVRAGSKSSNPLLLPSRPRSWLLGSYRFHGRWGCSRPWAWPQAGWRWPGWSRWCRPVAPKESGSLPSSPALQEPWITSRKEKMKTWGRLRMAASSQGAAMRG